MESVYDYDVNEPELNYLLIKDSKEVYLKNVSTFKRFSDLYHLFRIRGNENKAEEVYQRMLDQ